VKHRPYDVVEDDDDEEEDEPRKARDPRRGARITYCVLKWVFVSLAGICWLGQAAESSYVAPDTVISQILTELAHLRKMAHYLMGCMFMLAAIFCQLEEHRREKK
jgi:hypothetical protein